MKSNICSQHTEYINDLSLSRQMLEEAFKPFGVMHQREGPSVRREEGWLVGWLSAKSCYDVAEFRAESG